MEIYVDELPKSCKECKCAFNTFRQRVNETGSYMEECMCCIPLNEWLVEKHPNCPLKPLSYRLAEERKKVVQEIREPIIKSLENGVVRKNPKSSNTNLRDIILFQMLDILDQIERGGYE